MFQNTLPPPLKSPTTDLFVQTKCKNELDMRISPEICAEYLSRSIGQKLKCRLKVFTDYSEGHI